MEKLIVCYIQAFDCEHTVEAAMRSVLAQCYDNWLCFVLSNGNRDAAAAPNRTFDVIRRVAREDSRFVVLNKAVNSLDAYLTMTVHLAQAFPESYICLLDADDEYRSDFFARAADLMETNGLDIVACGTEITKKQYPGAKDGTLLRKRALGADLIVRGEEFSTLFPVYKPFFFNEMWGKLYQTALFSNRAVYGRNSVERQFRRRLRMDTLFLFELLPRCSAIGVLSGTSHMFCQFERRQATNATAMLNDIAAKQMTGWKLNRREEDSVYTAYHAAMSFLRAHGKITGTLFEYMQAILFGWCDDFFERVLLPATDTGKVARLARRLVFRPEFDALMRYRDSGKYDNLRNFESRKEFCIRLRNFLCCQEALKNRSFLAFRQLDCTRHTKTMLRQMIAKLDGTIQILSNLQSGGN